MERTHIYTPAQIRGLTVGAPVGRDDIIALYYHSGYTIREICGFLVTQHETILSERQVHRILRRLNLFRRNNESPLQDIVNATIQELSGTGRDIGYRSMRRRLLIDHGLVASCELVRLVLSVIDPEGVALRGRRSIRRRTYYNKGPNYAIHIDGWDKLKPFGVSVHGAVDGFSKRVLWLHACDSNKKPQYIAGFYLNFVREINGIPLIIYADRGTENSIIRDIQYALRWHHADPFQGLSSFIYGSSLRNTRIERFWGSMRAMSGTTWINIFKDMEGIGLLDTSDNVHMECVRYCFIRLINIDLQRVVQHWNEHRVRQSRNAECPGGKPDVLYFQPEIYMARDYKLPIGGNIQAIENRMCDIPPADGVSDEFRELAGYIVQQHRLKHPPDNIYEALHLFTRLISEIDTL